MKNVQEKTKTVPLFMKAEGKLPYRLTNDYLFRALLQENSRVLKSLICAVKHLAPENVKSVVIQNPIMLGAAIDNKTFILDIRVEMNDSTVINFEMQAYTMKGWKERSLLYLCRAFDDIHKGDEYISVKEVMHIGFLDFTLFPQLPEFHATYKLLNVKNHQVYSDNFVLTVIDLTRIDLATEEDKKFHIDDWARLFKATTWEEIRMISEKDETIRDAAETIYELSQDQLVREQCRAREDYNRQMDYYNRQISDYNRQMDYYNRQISDYNRQMDYYSKQIDDYKRQTDNYSRQIDDYSRQLSDQKKQLEEQQAEIERLKSLLEEKS